MALKKLLTDLSSFGKDYLFSQKYPRGSFNGSGGSPYSTPPDAIAKGSFDQKSLKFGIGRASDRPGGGFSGQPFITVPFENSFGLPLEKIGGSGLDNDLFIRGGASVAKHIKDDGIRIGKFLASPQGLLFIAQQNTLEKTNKPHLPNDIYPREIYSPLNTLSQIAGNALGTHINKSGLNPFYFDFPHGQGDITYFKKTKDKYNELNKNRLTILYQSKIINNITGSGFIVDATAASGFDIKFNSPNFIINSPLSSYRRVDNTTKDIVIVNKEQAASSKFSTIISSELAQTNPKQYNSTNINGSDGVLDFRDSVPSSTTFKSFLAKSNYLTNNRQSTFGMSDPGLRSKDVSDISALTSGTPSDSINLSSIYSGSVSSSLSNSDLIPFYFQVVNNDDPSQYEFLHFRAYLDSFSDSFTGNWTPFKYMGRGENFYIYDSFTRGISLGFTVAVESRKEQEPQYQKINYLASLTAPDYSKTTGFMRGSFVKLTVGDYLVQVPGFISTVNYSIANNVPWDIARGNQGEKLTSTKILPMVISVTMNFTPVHSFVPKKGANFISSNPEIKQ